MKKILIADNVQNSSLILTSILNEYYEIFPAYNEIDMFSMLESEELDLIVLSDGFQGRLISDIIPMIKKKDKSRSALTILLSSAITQALVMECKSLNVADLIKKPYEPVNLITRIAEALVKATPVRERKDELTGLRNRVFAGEQIQEWMSSEQNSGGTMMLIDVDKYSYASGCVDKPTIKECASVMVKLLEKEDVLSRLSGSRFIAYLKNITDRSTAMMKAESVLRNLSETAGSGGLYISIGLAISPADGENYDDLFKKCDMALHFAHQKGTNTACFYN